MEKEELIGHFYEALDKARAKQAEDKPEFDLYWQGKINGLEDGLDIVLGIK